MLPQSLLQEAVVLGVDAQNQELVLIGEASQSDSRLYSQDIDGIFGDDTGGIGTDDFGNDFVDNQMEDDAPMASQQNFVNPSSMSTTGGLTATM